MSNDARTPQGSGDLGILTGFDGSEHARDALLYAARAAQSAGTQLTVVNAYTIPPMVYGVPAEFSVEDSLEVHARAILDEARELLDGYPGKRSEEHTSELQSRGHLVCRLLLAKKNYGRQLIR